MSGFLLDTHVWFWLLGELEGGLSAQDTALLNDAARQGDLHLSAMSIWETAQKQASGKLQVSVEALMERSMFDGGIKLVQLTIPILVNANRLPGTIQGDPVDRILAATALELNLTLVTRDAGLRRYGKQGHLRVYEV